ncbi:MAG: 50S ribosomal protein L11 methyltransferase [Rhodospirillaceae bacterium]|nr:50S ribosomal protein L11 methyltransferase [Rhodospirillaceae bacterium]|tara:strand:+ start:270 stop:1151 length:882 start_codon:yes stop_codon:yes gene_type:complete
MTGIWEFHLKISEDYVPLIEEYIEPYMDALSLFKVGDTNIWEIHGLIDGLPNVDDIKKTLSDFSNQLGCRPLEYDFRELPARDWVAENRLSFPKIRYGRFTIHGSHNRPLAPNSALNLELEAGRAFGSGTHASTEGCLRALLHLDQFFKPKKILDIGCGSGVLSIAAARLWRNTAIVALDIDSDAVKTTQENAKLNRVAQRIYCYRSEGFPMKEPAGSKKFDIITANILAGPLIQMAPKTGRWLRVGGFVVLSGLLSSQEREVLGVYNSLGFNAFARRQISDWTTLVLRYKFI